MPTVHVLREPAVNPGFTKDSFAGHQYRSELNCIFTGRRKVKEHPPATEDIVRLHHQVLSLTAGRFDLCGDGSANTDGRRVGRSEIDEEARRLLAMWRIEQRGMDFSGAEALDGSAREAEIE